MASFVEMFVIGTRGLAIGPGRNHSSTALCYQAVTDTLIGVVRLICQERFDLIIQLLKQDIGAIQIAALSCRQVKACWVTQRIASGVNLCAQPTFAAPDGLVVIVFFAAPALC